MSQAFATSILGSAYVMAGAVTAGVISVIAAAFMIRTAIAVGFSAFVAPIMLAELVFLGAVYAL